MSVIVSSDEVNIRKLADELGEDVGWSEQTVKVVTNWLTELGMAGLKPIEVSASAGLCVIRIAYSIV